MNSNFISHVQCHYVQIQPSKYNKNFLFTCVSKKKYGNSGFALLGGIIHQKGNMFIIVKIILMISHMDSLLFALALEVCLQQIRIVEGRTALRGVAHQCANTYDKLMLNKLLRDRKLVKDVIRGTLIEMAEGGLWNMMQRAAAFLTKRASSAFTKRLDRDLLEKLCYQIAHELDTKRNQWALDLRNADTTVALLRDKMKDELLNANTRLCFAEKWVCARAEGHELRLRSQRQPAPAPRFDYEQRVHEESLKLFELQIKEYEAASEYWRGRYADDIAEMNELLAGKRNELKIIMTRREELQSLYDLHAGEMRAWTDFKRQRAARLAREALVRTSAARVQAWWRGVMVRRALGPFKYLKNVKKAPGKSKKK